MMKQPILAIARLAISALILITSGPNHGTAFGMMINPRSEIASALHQDASPTKGELMYEDSFDTKKGGWKESEDDNLSIGYLEPTYYHVDVLAPNDRAIATIPKEKFIDFTLETTAFVEPNNTDQAKDFRFGLIFRRIGQEFYTFTISPLTKTWHVQKSSANALIELASGASELIQSRKLTDTLRVDAIGSTFAVYINNQLVRRFFDQDYASGEAGFFVQTLAAQRVQIQYDNISVFKTQFPIGSSKILYEENFDTKKGGWSETEYDNYTKGYHEPTFYHIDVHAPHDRALATIPKKKFGNLALEATALVEQNNTSPLGDYRFGLVFRRSGQQYYAFTISPSTKTWHMQKSSAAALIEIKSGAVELIQSPKFSDTLRVEAIGPTFTLYINNQPVGRIRDPDYSEGEAGFFVQTLDSAHVHVHYDDITVRDAGIPKVLCNVISPTLMVRDTLNTPYKALSPLKKNTYFEPLARSSDFFWLYIRLNTVAQFGWIANASNSIACNGRMSDLPLYRK